MDVQSLSVLFATTYNPDPNVRKAGELEIRKIGGQEGILTAIIHVIANDSVDIATRQACSVYLKNRVDKCYHLTEPSKERSDLKPIASSDRDALKSSILPLIVAAPTKAIAVQLASSVRHLVAHDFPDKWPGFIDAIKAMLASNDIREITGASTVLLEVIRAFRYKPQSDILHGVVGETFPQLVSIGAQALATYPAGATQESSRLLHLILKIYSSSITASLSKHQQSAESLVPWGRLLFQMVNAQLPKDAVPEDEEEREKCEWWKAKKWAFKVLCTLFHRYGNPSQMPSTHKKDYLQFAEHFVSSFAPEIFKVYLQQVELLISGQAWLSQKCQFNVFYFFNDCVKPKSTWELLKPHFLNLVSAFVAPQLCFTPAKQELWNDDPLEFVRAHIDEYEDFSMPVSAATSFLSTLASTRTKTTFLPILGFINSTLESNAPPEQKYGALNMTSALAQLIMRHPQVRTNMENFLVQHVLPGFNSEHTYIRAMSCEVLYSVEKVKMEWSNSDNLKAAFTSVATSLDHPELPVRIQAALALTEMITSHESVREQVKPQVAKVVHDYLKLSDETDMDVLNTCMETLVESYHNELLPVAGELTARLCESYLRIAREIAANTGDSEDVLDKSMDFDTMEEDKTFAAMGITKTIGTIISSVESSAELLGQVEQYVVPIIVFTLENKLLDLFDNVYELVDALTFNMRKISPSMWQVYELTHKLFKSDAINFLDEMLPSLDNFLSYGSAVVRERADYKLVILDIYTTAMASTALGEQDRVNANKLIESFLLNLRGAVDEALQTIIAISLEHLGKENSRPLKLAILEALINAVLYNPSAALHLMETIQPNSSCVFFDKWFALLKSEKGLPRVHDKKLSILALCALLEMDPATIPAPLVDGWAGIVAAILHVFRDLPKAVEARKALEDSLVADDDTDTDGEDLILAIDEDDDKDVWDEESEYIDMLAKEGARLRAKSDDKVTTEDDSDEESDDESIDEELGYISPLETVNPYVTFKQALTAFQMKNGPGYQAATTSLNVEQQTALMEYMAIADKNPAA